MHFDDFYAILYPYPSHGEFPQKERYSIMKAARKDIALIPNVHPYTTPEAIPVTYTLGGKLYRGFPAEFNPKAIRRRIDSCIYETVVTATTPEGLTLRAECT